MESLIHHALLTLESLPFTPEKGSGSSSGERWKTVWPSSQASHPFRHLFWLWVECERSWVSKYRVENRDAGILLVPTTSVLNLGHSIRALCLGFCICYGVIEPSVKKKCVHPYNNSCLVCPVLRMQIVIWKKYIIEVYIYLY